MSSYSPAPEVPVETARALVRTCPGSGAPLTGRQQAACSGKCRAKVSRERRARNQDGRDEKLRRLLAAARANLEAAERMLWHPR
jgi:hypothetical protein